MQYNFASIRIAQNDLQSNQFQPTKYNTNLKVCIKEKAK